LEDAALVEIMTPAGPGHAPGDPIALVKPEVASTAPVVTTRTSSLRSQNSGPQGTDVIPRKDGYHATLVALCDCAAFFFYFWFTIDIICLSDSGNGLFLPFKRGDVLYTDGISRETRK
jgi:hypothetical protein